VFIDKVVGLKGDTLAAFVATRPFPMARVKLFVAVEGGGILVENAGRLGAFPDVIKRSI